MTLPKNPLYYLAGPMTGLPEQNYPAFDEAKHALEEKGLRIASPHDIQFKEPNGRGSLPWEVYMKAGLKMMLECDGIILLPGWVHSHGARVEFDLATKLNLDVYRYVPGSLIHARPASLELF